MAGSRKTQGRGAPRRRARNGILGRPKGTGTQVIYAELRRRILRLDLAPGADLDEQALVREFKLSRTPVREALLRLAHEELVEIIPNRGTRVTGLQFPEVGEIFDSLEILTRVTSRWAALHRTPPQLDAIRRHSREFAEAAAANHFDRMSDANRSYHLAIAEAAGNRHFHKMLDALLTLTMRYAYMTLARGTTIADIFPGGFRQINTEHDELIALIEQGDAEGADRLAGQHLRLFRAKVMRLVDLGLPSKTPLGGMPAPKPKPQSSA
jgi:DNA-binding GntR family transcriptional regulator